MPENAGQKTSLPAYHSNPVAAAFAASYHAHTRSAAATLCIDTIGTAYLRTRHGVTGKRKTRLRDDQHSSMSDIAISIHLTGIPFFSPPRSNPTRDHCSRGHPHPLASSLLPVASSQQSALSHLTLPFDTPALRFPLNNPVLCWLVYSYKPKKQKE